MSTVPVWCCCISNHSLILWCQSYLEYLKFEVIFDNLFNNLYFIMCIVYNGTAYIRVDVMARRKLCDKILQGHPFNNTDTVTTNIIIVCSMCQTIWTKAYLSFVTEGVE